MFPNMFGIAWVYSDTKYLQNSLFIAKVIWSNINNSLKCNDNNLFPQSIAVKRQKEEPLDGRRVFYKNFECTVSLRVANECTIKYRRWVRAVVHGVSKCS